MKKFLIACVVVTAISSSLAHAASESPVLIMRDGTPLKAVLTLPEGEVRAAALLLQGSGNVGADGDFSSPFTGAPSQGHAAAPLSRQMAERLASEGVATLRYNKRGFDDATQLPKQTLPYLIGDAIDAFETLKLRFPGVKKFMIGTSEGATLAVNAQATVKADALFLFALPTRPFDEVLAYMSFEWPLDVLTRLDRDLDGTLSPQEIAGSGLAALPFTGASWKTIDADGNGALDFITEIVPAYQANHLWLMGVARSPGFIGWYESMKAAPSLESLTRDWQTPVWMYHGTADTQVSWRSAFVDSSYFKKYISFRIFDKLGHGFAFLEGPVGERKTSGPMESAVLEQLATDIRTLTALSTP